MHKLILIFVLSIAAMSFSLCGLADDSTEIAPMQNPVVEAPASNIKAPVIQNEQYQNLPVCPNPITLCPDINGKSPPGGSQSTCPDVCTVTQSPVSGPPSVTTTNAVCPTGYVQEAVYNSQPEKAYNPNPVTYWPQTMDQYYKYINLGYTCADSANHGRYQPGGCSSDSPRWNNGTITQDMPTAPGQVVDMYNFQQYCFSPLSNCQVPASCDFPAAEWYFAYNYHQISCIQPPGNYATGQYIPVSAVCARAGTTWQQNN